MIIGFQNVLIINLHMELPINIAYAGQGYTTGRRSNSSVGFQHTATG